MALLDADLQTYPEDLPKLIEMLENETVDAVVGIRAERHEAPDDHDLQTYRGILDPDALT